MFSKKTTTEADENGVVTAIIPYSPRYHQALFHKNAKRFNVLVCHRSMGKTIFSINEIISKAVCKPNGLYVFMAPLQNQAKRVAWDEFKFYASAIPYTKFNNSELRITFPNGARIMILGADNADSLRGMHLDGLVMDEVAQMAPEVWTEVMRPTLSIKKGWAIFIGTKKGKNLFYDLYEAAEGRPDWYRALVTVSESGVVSEEEQLQALAEMGPDKFAQEYGDKWDSSVKGSYYAAILNEIEANGQITKLTWNPALPVITAWDIGMKDKTCIWFAQVSGQNINIIDYYENSEEVLAHYAGIILAKPYAYKHHILPHDVNVRNYDTGRTRKHNLESLGLKIHVATKSGIDDGINASRVILPRCFFDAEKCAEGLKALRHYRTEYDPIRQMYTATPFKDWSNHASDAFRYLAMEIKTKTPPRVSIPNEGSYDPFNFKPGNATQPTWDPFS